MNGWIKLERSSIENWTFQKPDYFRAWIDLLVRANHTEKKKLYNNTLVVVKRGELVTSLGALAERWDMSVGRVRHFLQLLEKDGMILKKNTQDFTHLSICEYETYQNSQHTDNTLTTHSQQIDNKLTATPKERKNVKNDKKERSIVQNSGELLNEFESFWNLYDKKINRSKCEKKWACLKANDKYKIFETLPEYVKATPDSKYRKNPLTYLNNRGWEDEIIQNKSSSRISMEEIMSVQL